MRSASIASCATSSIPTGFLSAEKPNATSQSDILCGALFNLFDAVNIVCVACASLNTSRNSRPLIRVFQHIRLTLPLAAATANNQQTYNHQRDNRHTARCRYPALSGVAESVVKPETVTDSSHCSFSLIWSWSAKHTSANSIAALYCRAYLLSP